MITASDWICGGKVAHCDKKRSKSKQPSIFQERKVARKDTKLTPRSEA